AALWALRQARRACLGAVERGVDEARLKDGALVALACQASLITFSFGAMFLSLEVFELPWLLIVLAGVMPAAVKREIEQPQKPAAADLAMLPGRSLWRPRVQGAAATRFP